MQFSMQIYIVLPNFHSKEEENFAPPPSCRIWPLSPSISGCQINFKIDPNVLICITGILMKIIASWPGCQVWQSASRGEPNCIPIPNGKSHYFPLNNYIFSLLPIYLTLLVSKISPNWQSVSPAYQ